MPNFLKKALLVLANILVVGVVCLAIVGLSNSIYIKPNEIGVMETIKSDKESVLSVVDPGLHMWPFEKGWKLLLLSKKISRFETGTHRVCVENVKVQPFDPNFDRSVNIYYTVCSEMELNPDTITIFYAFYNDKYKYSGLDGEQAALAEATYYASYDFSMETVYDRQLAEEEIATFFKKEMETGLGQMMMMRSIQIMQITIWDLN